MYMNYKLWCLSVRMWFRTVIAHRNGY